MRAILDSGPIIGLWNSEDQFNIWARQLFDQYAGPFHVSESVLTEVAHITGRDRLIADCVRSGYFLLSEGFKEIEEIGRCLGKFSHCDLSDATVIVLSERYPRLNVLTTDRRHFITYRRADGNPLPVVLPD